MRQTTTGVGLVALLVLTIPFASSVFAQDESPQASRDWAQWLGPQRDGHIQESAWLAGWPKLQVEEAWKQDVGIGYASVSVVGDRAYTAGFKGGEDTIYCLEAATGKVVWKHSYDAKKYALMNAGGPSATPSIVDSRVYTVSRDAVMLCLSADKGDVLWKKDLKKTHQAKVPTWGFSGSPLVRGDRVYVDVGTIIAFDRRTGEEVWKTSRYRAGYSSPIAFRFENKDYLAVFPANGLIVLDEADGSEIASYPWDTNYDVNAATPVMIGDGRIFISSGYNTGAAMLRFDGKRLTREWKTKKMRNQMATSVYWEGHLYGFDESRLTCLDAETGKVKWKQRGLGKGSLMICEGKLLVLGGNGKLAIAEADPTGFKPVLERETLTGGDCWTVPVVSHGRIFCRDPRAKLVCLEVKTEGEAPKSPNGKSPKGAKSF